MSPAAAEHDQALPSTYELMQPSRAMLLMSTASREHGETFSATHEWVRRNHAMLLMSSATGEDPQTICPELFINQWLVGCMPGPLRSMLLPTTVCDPGNGCQTHAMVSSRPAACHLPYFENPFVNSRACANDELVGVSRAIHLIIAHVQGSRQGVSVEAEAVAPVGDFDALGRGIRLVGSQSAAASIMAMKSSKM